jgi:hypothetical protein
MSAHTSPPYHHPFLLAHMLRLQAEPHKFFKIILTIVLFCISTPTLPDTCLLSCMVCMQAELHKKSQAGREAALKRWALLREKVLAQVRGQWG